MTANWTCSATYPNGVERRNHRWHPTERKCAFCEMTWERYQELRAQAGMPPQPEPRFWQQQPQAQAQG